MNRPDIERIRNRPDYHHAVVIDICDYALLLEKALNLACKDVFLFVTNGKGNCSKCLIKFKCNGHEQEDCPTTFARHYLDTAGGEGDG